MPFRKNPSYAMISFDADCNERRDDPDGLMSDQLEALAASDEITNIFLFSHGWNGDVEEAFDQYDRWVSALEAHTADRARAEQIFPGFKPLYIGIHWPSLAFGNESLGGGTSFAAAGGAAPEALVESYVQQFGDTPAIRAAIGVLVEDARTNADADEMSAQAVAAVHSLAGELGLTDLDMDFEVSQESSFGGGLDMLLGPLRMLSYWTMKQRARNIGETAGHYFLKRLQRATAAKSKPIHLMGHSFGCVVMSSILGGPDAQGQLERPVDSVALVQGAVSLWSYAEKIPVGEGTGYFHCVAADAKVRGPLITTQSKHDRAVNAPYVAASLGGRQISFAPAKFPIFGAIGRYGLRGIPTVDLPMKPASEPYPFERGHIYNLESTAYIKQIQGFATGAHSDIDGPEVAHAIWEAAFASAR